jgi:pyruvate/2-oxoglutarate/acetoin dehydrogenase E1 component
VLFLEHRELLGLKAVPVEDYEIEFGKAAIVAAKGVMSPSWPLR